MVTLVMAERNFVFEMPTNWNIKNANRTPRREKLISLHVKKCLFQPSIFPILLNFYSVGYLFNKTRASDWLLWNQIS